MYDFHYFYMIENFEGCKLLFTDTDSVCYSIPDVEDIYAKMNDNEWLDFSNFPSGHSNYSEENEMVAGKFKDECPNNPILEFVVLRSKMYSTLHIKGIKRQLPRF